MITNPGLPTLDKLQEHLTLLLTRNGVSDRLVRLEREPNPFCSAFPSEVVHCRFESGAGRRLLLKYGVEHVKAGYGYWRNVNYEAKVYQYVLRGLPVTVPRFFGTFVYDTGCQECLVLEYLEKSLRLSKSNRDALFIAAEWLGRFHASTAAQVSDEDRLSFLTVHDADYYVGWARRTQLFAKQVRLEYPWLEEVCEHFELRVPVLLSGPRTTIHGEFYPANVLVFNEAIYPVDWQSAAIARGEIDLASLLEGWGHTDLVRECEEIYLRSRWPDSQPNDFHQALATARLFWPLRWLGSRREWITDRYRGYFEHLRQEAEYAGLL